MDSGDSQAPSDPVLEGYLAAPPESSERELHALIVDRVQPIVVRVLTVRVTRGWPGDDLRDLQGEALLRILRRLREVREQRHPRIASLVRYVVAVSAHVYAEFLRQKYPLRYSFRRRVRHLVTHDPRFVCRRTAAGEWQVELGGRGSEGIPAPARSRGDDLPAQLRDILSAAARPLSIDALLYALNGVNGVAASHAPLAAPDLVSSIVDAAATRAGTRLSAAETLGAVWSEIRTLPTRQVAALLLHLRDEKGSSVIDYFPETGTASLRDLAAAMAVPDLTFATLWRELPLDDLRIGALLGVTRQQVINLRKSARLRLARRLRRRGVL